MKSIVVVNIDKIVRQIEKIDKKVGQKEITKRAVWREINIAGYSAATGQF